MPGIDPSVSCHSLNVNPNARPVKQKQRRFAPECNWIIAEEIDRLFDAGFIREVGIEASPAQAGALTKNAEPTTVKEVQTLMGQIAALSRFISKLSNHCKPFFDTIRSHGRQVWGNEQRLALTALKEYMENLPILLAPEPGEKLFLYLGVSTMATSGVLISCAEGKQYPVFYVSKTMTEAERRYLKAERVILSLVHAKRKLRIILHKLDLSGRMTKWPIELFDITYEPRTAVKGQVVADFLLECDSEDMEEDLCDCLWKLFVDGSSNQMGAGTGSKLQTPEGTSLSQALRLEFRATNNEAEYEALLAGLKFAKELKVNGEYETKDETMEAYHSAVMWEAKNFEKIEFIQIPREHNEDADRLACSASCSGETLAKVIPVGILNQQFIFDEPSGSDPWQLYRRSFSGPYLKYVTPTEARQILRAIHEGVCGNQGL
ncbi:uncharacterized protein LOC132282110 [Cornus florida]|uniref:uncharacterized protein LOC132282110 n=1 Tax=Cornus florida TaxID=4283 RepID=UPI002897A13C|nr:uncharacterized protein LOC132282110 [Cornus florida]